MSRPREKNNYIHPVVILRINNLCFGARAEFYNRWLRGHVDFDLPRFVDMMKENRCTAREEAQLYYRLAAVEREIRATYAAFDLIDEGQVQWAVETLGARQ